MLKRYQRQVKSILIYLVYMGALVCNYTQTAMLSYASPEKIILCFDIDDVLLIKKRSHTIKSLLKRTGPLAAALFQPKLLKRVRDLKKQGVPTEVLAAEFEKMHKPKLAKLVREIAHSKVPQKNMARLLRDLKGRGYTLHVLSNMGKADFEFYRKKYPEIFNFFDAALVVEYIPGKKVLKKPDPAYFDLYRSTFPTDKQHLFIDDKKENCDVSGFADTITFVSVHQLRLELNVRTIL